MKTINSDAGTFGPFVDVQTMDDRLVADGVEFQFDVLGTYLIEDGAPPPPILAPQVPEDVAMWQARDELIERGLLDTVNAAIASIPDPVQRLRAQSKFEYSNMLRRDDLLLLQMQGPLGWPDAFLDQLFISAGARK